jgi:gamma-glutamylcyclotransferase (GGCT)/AIG2-like uncharacterized protein YtfP
LQRLFVYGTLRRGCDNKYARLLSERGKFVGPASVSGRLHDFGRYPGARPGHGPIFGEIFQIEDSLLATLDEYEGAEFQREITPTSRNLDCWIYWYVGPAKGRLIESGDWLNR